MLRDCRQRIIAEEWHAPGCQFIKHHPESIKISASINRFS